MSNLQEFLRRQAEEQRGSAESRERVRRDWVESLESLVAQVVGWLREADPEKILRIERTEHDLREEKIGQYTAPGLKINLGAHAVDLVPLARFVVGPYLTSGGIHVNRADGRVDLTDGQSKYRLYRIRDEEGEHWMMIDDRNLRSGALTRESFESAVQSMLE